PVSAAFQCPSLLPISDHQCRISVPIRVAFPVPISDAYQCHLSVSITPPISTHHQCCLSVPYINATYQCCLSVSPISAAYPCHLISAAYQCPSVLPISALQHRLLVPISAASSMHISEGEKLPV
ncbi:unnamed protein product, partial [Staurois parvus]